MKLNKLLFVLFAMALSLGFTSCGDDDDDNEYENTIIGTWTSISREVVVDTENEIVSNAMSQVFTDDAPIIIWTFNKDKTCSGIAGVYESEGTYRLDGNKLYIKDNDDDEEIYTISFSGKNLVNDSYEEVDGTVGSRDPFEDTAQYNKIEELVHAKDNTIKVREVILKSISHKIVFKKK